MALQRILLYGLILIVLVAPLPFGAVEPGSATTLVVACLTLGIAWVAWRARRGRTPLPWSSPALGLGVLVVCIGLVQLVPLPRTALEAVSPTAVELRDRHEPEVATPADDAPLRTGRYEGWRPISLYPWATRHAVIRFVAWLLIALVTVDVIALDSARRSLALALVVSGAFQAIYGLAEFLSGHQHIFGYLKRYDTTVATGTLINRNHFAGFLEMTLPLALALSARMVSRLGAVRRTTTGARARVASFERLTASALPVLTLAMATALVCSGSRMGMASALLSITAVTLLMARRGGAKSFAAVVVILVGATLLVLGQAGAYAPMITHFLEATGELKGQVGRGLIWAQAIDMIRAFPLVGAGYGAFSYVFPSFRTSEPGIAYAHAHNDYLELTAETGLLGFGLVLLGVALVGRSLLRLRTVGRDEDYIGYAALSGAVAIALHSLADFNLAIPSNALTFAVLLGIVLGWRRAPAPTLIHSEVPHQRWAARAAAPAALLVILALLAVAPVASGARAAAPGGDGIPSPDRGSANGFGARWASLVDADNANRLFGMALRRGRSAIDDMEFLVEARADGTVPSANAVAYIRRRLDEAIRLQGVGLRHLPTSSKGHLFMGHLITARCAARSFEGGSGNECMGGAVREVRSALTLAPMSASAHAQAARFLIAARPLLDEAQRVWADAIVRRATGMNPDDSDLQRLAGRFH